MCHLRLSRKAGDWEDFEQNPSAYDALKGSFFNLYAPRTLDEVLAAALAAAGLRRTAAGPTSRR